MAGALTDSLVDGMAGVRTLAVMITIQPETGRMNKMKIVLASLCLASVPALSAAPSLARDYPFCRKGEAGPGDCRYETLEQCQAAVSGTAGYCQPNYWLPPAGRNAVPPRSLPSVG